MTVERILSYPDMLRTLESERVRKSALYSSDIGAFMDFIAQPSGLSPADKGRRIVNEIDGLISGAISKELFFERYRGHILALSLGAVAIAAFVFRKRRREPVRGTRRTSVRQTG